MRGKILGANADGGVVSAEDGKRYKYLSSQWNGDRSPSPGDEVDFEIDGDGKAIDLFRLAPAAAIPTAGDQKQGTIFGVISLICGLLGFTPGIGILFAIAAFFLGRVGREKAIAEGDTTGATLCKIGMVLAIIVFVLVVAALFLGLGFLGLLFGGLSIMH